MSVTINPADFESKKRLDALISAANTKTNGYAEDITSAMQTLLDGYGAGGGGVASEGVAAKAVNFYDYDGTRLYAYTLAEARALTELPIPPEHDGLVFDGWNWELSEVNALTIPAEIGALYNTVDNITRIKIYIDEVADRTFGFKVAGIQSSVVWSVDYGDGNTVEYTGGATVSHTYENVGSYVVKIISDRSTYNLFSTNAGSDFVRAIEYSKQCKQAQMTLGFNTQYVTVHSALNINDGTVFHTRCKIFPRTSTVLTAREDTGTKIISIPPTMTSYGTYGCQMTQIIRVSVPEGVGSVGNRAFRSCPWLRKVVMPSTITTMAAQAFDSANRLAVMIVLPTTPPTITSNTLNAFPANCVIYVPDDSVEAYKVAEYWSVYAEQIQGLSNYTGDDIWRE